MDKLPWVTAVYKRRRRARYFFTVPQHPTSPSIPGAVAIATARLPVPKTVANVPVRVRSRMSSGNEMGKPAFRK